jgi:hypothetical protein
MHLTYLFTFERCLNHERTEQNIRSCAASPRRKDSVRPTKQFKQYIDSATCKFHLRRLINGAVRQNPADRDSDVELNHKRPAQIAKPEKPIHNIKPQHDRKQRNPKRLA